MEPPKFWGNCILIALHESDQNSSDCSAQQTYWETWRDHWRMHTRGWYRARALKKTCYCPFSASHRLKGPMMLSDFSWPSINIGPFVGREASVSLQENQIDICDRSRWQDQDAALLWGLLRCYEMPLVWSSFLFASPERLRAGAICV